MNTRTRFLRELDARSTRLATIIRDVFDGLRSAADMGALRDAIERRDVDAVLAALSLNAGTLGAVTADLAQSHAAAAGAQIAAVVKAAPRAARIVAGFDPGNPVAAGWARDTGSRLVQEIAEDTRAMVRETIGRGLDAGASPYTTAREVRQTVGLHSLQARAVANARAELSDPEAMGGYFTRKRRDQRFDATVRKAMRDGRKLSAADVDRIVGRYAERLRAYRSEVIARTETLAALSAGRQEGMRQMIESGKLRADQVARVWDATGDRKTRSTHAAADGQRQPWGEPFIVGGYRMMHPGDSMLGAPAAEVVQCRCWEKVTVDFLAGLRAA